MGTYPSEPLLAMVSESRRGQALTPHLGRSLSLASRRNGFFALHPWIQTLPLPRFRLSGFVYSQAFLAPIVRYPGLGAKQVSPILQLRKLRLEDSSCQGQGRWSSESLNRFLLPHSHWWYLREEPFLVIEEPSVCVLLMM